LVHILFLCSQNKLRSPTAEHIFADCAGIETLSAGLNKGAITPLSPDLLAWADVIFVMEKTHRRKLSERFKADLHNKKIICLNIPDHYDYMEDNLVNLLRQKVTPYLPPSL
jgi:predicted protein tyrosine phosphatase